MPVLKNACQPGHPYCAIAFPNEKLRRTPTFIMRNKMINPISQVVQVSVDSKKYLLLPLLRIREKPVFTGSM